jgi:hypothetical protein
VMSVVARFNPCGPLMECVCDNGARERREGEEGTQE